jgi:hypothetical protein
VIGITRRKPAGVSPTSIGSADLYQEVRYVLKLDYWLQRVIVPSQVLTFFGVALPVNHVDVTFLLSV